MGAVLSPTVNAQEAKENAAMESKFNASQLEELTWEDLIPENERITFDAQGNPVFPDLGGYTQGAIDHSGRNAMTQPLVGTIPSRSRWKKCCDFRRLFSSKAMEEL